MYRYKRRHVSKPRPKTYTIERGKGATYQNQRFTVYGHDVYPHNSVLAGQERRTFEESYPTLEEAQKVWPQAVWISGTTFREPDLSHLPDDTDY